jgi:hypothetical protein
MNALEIIEIGDSMGFILPEDVLKRFKVGADDTLFLTETARGFTLTTVDPQLAHDGAASLPPIEVPSPTLNQNKK